MSDPKSCDCGRVKRSAFHHFCDACFEMLPRDLRGPLTRHSAGTRAGNELHAKAVKWLTIEQPQTEES